MSRLKWRSQWSTWKYKHGYYSISNYNQKYEDMRIWCRDNFADNWQIYNRVWRFRFKRDYQLFLLRWA